MMGLEEHLLQMFRDDFEFNDQAQASHLHAHAPSAKPAAADDETDGETLVMAEAPSAEAVWTLEAERELKKIPFFVRGKARRNTELFAARKGIRPITVETLYDAKAHFAR